MIVPNSIVFYSETEVVVDGETYQGFYVSFNDYDIMTYGDVTTALVLGQMQKFYILNGNHTEEYKKLEKGGFHACMEYFKQNVNQMNKYSDELF